MRALVVLLAVVTVTIVPVRTQRQGDRGVLLLAHGGRAEWNANVRAIAAEVDRVVPTAVAFGMAQRPAIAAAVESLRARGVSEIVAVPLFVSSHSSVVTATQYLLGLRPEAPPELEIFARMSHGADDAGGHQSAAGGTTPIDAGVRVRMTAALDGHPLVADIVLSRALALSRDPAEEIVLLVAHGPTGDADNEHWIAGLRQIGDRLARQVPFTAVLPVSLRDDAPPAVRDEATARLRGLVEGASAVGSRVLVVPVLLSYGGIEAGIRRRLDGLTYEMSGQALAPDPRLVDWVLAVALR
jgi:sirohydrochlorin ferrochelatase